jgi:hypothetical protein
LYEGATEAQIYARGTAKIVILVFKDIPHFMILSFVLVVLYYRSVKHFMTLKVKCMLVDEDVRFFSSHDICYCVCALRCSKSTKQSDKAMRKRFMMRYKTRLNSNLNEGGELSTDEEEEEESEKESVKNEPPQRDDVGGGGGGGEGRQAKSKPFRLKLRKFIRKYVYKWHDEFRFSSRIINTHVVAVLALYYFMLDWLLFGYILIQALMGTVSDALYGLLFVFDEIEINIPFEPILVQESYVIGFILSSIVSFCICLIQVFLGIKNIQQDLILLYRGRNYALTKKLNNTAIATGHNQFAGFLVGFIINGFLFIFIFFFLICLIIYYCTQYVSIDMVGQFVLKLVPILVVLIIKILFNFFFSKFVFLQERGKHLAVDNYRAYSVFLYVLFFFDCFVGALNAFVRMIIGLLASIFFMPRIGYSFLGRHLERFDGGFKTSNGYYYLETSKNIALLFFLFFFIVFF